MNVRALKPAEATPWTDPVELQGLGRLTIRALTTSDADALEGFLDSLSDDTKRLRVLGEAGPPTETRMARLTRFDRARELALAALRHGEDGDEIIAVARYSAGDTPGEASFSIVVGDRFQGHCLGTELMCRLRDAAGVMGYRRMVGLTLPVNTPMLALARRLGCRVSPVPGETSLQRLSVAVPPPFPLPAAAAATSRRTSRRT